MIINNNVNTKQQFGLMATPYIEPIRPAIVCQCKGWLQQGKNSLAKISEAGVTLRKSRKSVDIYENKCKIGSLARPVTPLKLERFVTIVRDIGREFAEYTDSKIRLVKKKSTRFVHPENLKITTRNLKTQGRTNVQKSRQTIYG